MARNPRDAWAIHALAHGLYELAAFEEGVGRLPTRDPSLPASQLVPEPPRLAPGADAPVPRGLFARRPYVAGGV